MIGKKSKKSLICKIILTSRAKRELKSISRSRQIAIAHVIEDLKLDPSLGKSLNRDLLGKYSYRVGIYRIIYSVNKQDQTITILSAGHRSIIYKQ